MSLFDGKYGKAQIFDVQRSPAYPVAGQPFVLSNFQNIYDSTLNSTQVNWGVNNDRYVQFVNSATTQSVNPNAYEVSLNLYESNGTLVKTIANYGTVWALSAEGFFFEGHDKFGYFISNAAGYAYGSSLTYTPVAGLVTNLGDLTSYQATTSVLGVGQTASSSPSTVQFDFSSIYNADVIVTNSEFSNGYSVADGRFDNYAVFIENGVAGGDGIPSGGVIPGVSGVHPEVTLTMSGNNAWKVSGLGSAQATVTSGNYKTVHVFASAGDAGVGRNAYFNIILNYSDGTSTTSPQLTAPDWFDDAQATGRYQLIGGMDRLTTGGSLENVNDPAIFGFAVEADFTKTLTSITIDVTQNDAGVFAFFGGVASTESSTAAVAAVQADTTSPTAPVITSAELSNDSTPVITGTAEANSTVTLVIAGATYTTTANGSGAWSVDTGSVSVSNGTLTINANGSNSVSITATDAAGNVSIAETQTLVIDTTSPSAPVITSATLVNDSTPVITGTAEANSTVTLVISGATYTTTANGSGAWSVDTGSVSVTSGTLAINANGSNSVSVTATDAAGNVSNAQTLTLVIDTTSPVPPLITSAAQGNDTTPVITGAAEANSTVTLVISGATYTTTANGSGAWSVDTGSVSVTSGTLAINANGSNNVSVTATDAAGNVSKAETQTLVIDTTAPSPAGGSVVNDILVRFSEPISATVSDLTSVVLKDLAGTAIPANVSINANGELVIRSIESLKYNTSYYVTWGSGSLKDAAGNSAAAVSDANTFSFSTEPEQPQSPPDTTSQTQEPVPVTQTIDGTTVQITTTSNAVSTVISPVTTARVDDPSSVNSQLADIPLVQNSRGAAILTASLPVGVGMQVEQTLGSSSSPGTANGLLGLIQAIENRIAGSYQVSDRTEMTSVGTSFLQLLPNDTILTVRTIVPTVGTGITQLNQPIVLLGSANLGAQQEALVIDTRSLPASSTIWLDHVDFAAVIGQVRVIGGAGSQVITGDGSSQFIVLGADDDQLHGGGGSDTVGSKAGDDQLFGDDGNDWVVGGTGNDTLDGGEGDDVLVGGMSDAGTWTFQLNAQGNIVSRFTAKETALTDVSSVIQTGPWWTSNGAGIDSDDRLAFSYQSPERLKAVALLYKAVVGTLPTLNELNAYGASTLSMNELASLAVNHYLAKQGPTAQSLEVQLRGLIETVWGVNTATDTLIDLGVNHINRGGTWTDALLYLVNDPKAVTSITDAAGNLSLTQALVTLDLGLMSDAGDNVLRGGAGNDRLVGGKGNNTLDGGDGIDLAVFTGAVKDYTFHLQKFNDVVQTVATNKHTGAVNTLTSVEFVQIGSKYYGTDLQKLPALGVEAEVSSILIEYTEEQVELIGVLI